MAARRLAILVMTLIAISMAITVISQPLREQRTRERTTTTSPRETSTTPREPAAVPRETGKQDPTRQKESLLILRANGGSVVRVERGEPVTLVVQSERPLQISIPALGLVAFADRYAPARFAILARRTGKFAIEASPGGNAGTLIVRRASPGRTPR